MALNDHSEKFSLFVAVYEQGSFRKAAASLNMTQPPLSYAIKQLEGEIGQKLFSRSQQGVVATSSGEKLYRFCRRVLKEVQQVEEELQNPEVLMSGSLAVGTYDSIARYFWPQIIQSSQKKFPQLNLALTSGRTLPTMDLLQNRKIDYAIFVEPPKFPEMVRSLLYSDTYSLFQTTNKRVEVDRDVLIYVGGASIGGALTLETWITSVELDHLKPFRLDSFEVCREFIKKGLGIGILPNKVAKDDLQNGLIRKVAHKRQKTSFGKHGIYACYLSDNRQMPKIKEFNRLVKQVLN